MKEVRFALKHTFPIMLSYVFLGIAFGMLMTDAGYGIFLSVLSAIFIYAGSMQIAMIPMMTSGSPLIIMALMTIFINARHIFYGIGFIDKYKKMGIYYPYMIISLTDETYSILCSIEFEKDIDEKKAMLFISAFDHIYWILGCFLGAFAGEFIPFDFSGIEFSATALFLVIVINQWQKYKNKAPFITALVCAAGFYILLGPEYFLLPALFTSLVGLLIIKKSDFGKEAGENEQ